MILLLLFAQASCRIKPNPPTHLFELTFLWTHILFRFSTKCVCLSFCSLSKATWSCCASVTEWVVPAPCASAGRPWPVSGRSVRISRTDLTEQPGSKSTRKRKRWETKGRRNRDETRMFGSFVTRLAAPPCSCVEKNGTSMKGEDHWSGVLGGIAFGWKAFLPASEITQNGMKGKTWLFFSACSKKKKKNESDTSTKFFRCFCSWDPRIVDSKNLKRLIWSM